MQAHGVRSDTEDPEVARSAEAVEGVREWSWCCERREAGEGRIILGDNGFPGHRKQGR